MTEEQKQATIEKLEARLEADINLIERKMIESLIRILKGEAQPQ